MRVLGMAAGPPGPVWPVTATRRRPGQVRADVRALPGRGALQRGASRRPLTIAITASLIAVAVSLAGCAGAAPGTDLSLRSRGDPRLLRGSAETLRLPQDEKFCIRHQEATHRSDLDGHTAATAVAGEDGKGDVNASVRGGGSAAGVFQLGHSFRNDADVQLDLDLRIVAAYDYSVDASPEATQPDATAGLRLLARDDRGRRLRELVMIDATSESGSARGSDRKETHFTLTLAPRQTVHVFLAGAARCETKPGRSAEATLKVTTLNIEAATRPAPAVPSSAPTSR